MNLFDKIFSKQESEVTHEKKEGAGIINLKQEQEKNNKSLHQLLSQGFLTNTKFNLFPNNQENIIQYIKFLQSNKYNRGRDTITRHSNYEKIESVHDNIILTTDNNGDIETVHGSIKIDGENYGKIETGHGEISVKGENNGEIETTHGNIYIKSNNNKSINGIHGEWIILGNNDGNIIKSGESGNIFILGNNNATIKSKGNVIILGNNNGVVESLGKVYIEGNNTNNINANSEIFIFGNNSGIIDGGNRSILIWRNNETNGIIGGNQYKIIIGGSNFGQVGNARGDIEIYGEDKGKTFPYNSAMKNKLLDKNKVMEYILRDIQKKEEVWNLRGLKYPYDDNIYTRENTIPNTINNSKERTLKLIK